MRRCGSFNGGGRAFSASFWVCRIEASNTASYQCAGRRKIAISSQFTVTVTEGIALI